jgi:hypothetical protein
VKTTAMLLAALAAAVSLTAPAAHAIGECDDSNHDVQVRVRDICVLADLPPLPPHNL